MKAGIFSFFAGAGFLDLGFEKTEGFEIVFVNEFHKAFMDVYKGVRNTLEVTSPRYGHDTKDITDYLKGDDFHALSNNLAEAKILYDVTGMIGGPPCPDFSVAGKNKGRNGENGKLSYTYIDLVCRTTPDFFLFENVKGLYRTAKHREFFESLKTKLKKAGYYLTEHLINAIEYGVPQDRERIILIGFHKEFLAKYEVKKYQMQVDCFNWNAHTLYDKNEVFEKNWPQLDLFIENTEREIPENIVNELTVNYWFRKNNVHSHPNSKHFFAPRAGLIKFQTIPEGDDLKKSFKRLHRWRYSPTAAYGNNEVHLHPFLPRRISAAEALAIQSLPEDFIIPNHISLTDMFKTIGNGVPYLAAKGLAATISDFILNLEKKVEAKAHEEINS